MTTPTPEQIEAVITDIDTRMRGKSFAIMTAPEWLIISQAAALTAAAEVAELDIKKKLEAEMNEIVKERNKRVDWLTARLDTIKTTTIEHCKRVVAAELSNHSIIWFKICDALNKLKDSV